jgi:hypothetical protein
MSKEVRITTVSLEIGKKKIDLTVEEAKQLLDILSETFGAKPNTIIKEVEIYRDWYRPYIIYSQPYTNGYSCEVVSGTQTWYDIEEGNLTINVS